MRVLTPEEVEAIERRRFGTTEEERSLFSTLRAAWAERDTIKTEAEQAGIAWGEELAKAMNTITDLQAEVDQLRELIRQLAANGIESEGLINATRTTTGN